MRPLAALALFVALLAVTAVQTWPLAARLSSAIAHDPIDPLLNAWLLWHGAHVPPWSAGWWHPPAFAPMEGALALSEHLIGLLWLAAPLQWAGASPATTVNVLLLLAWPTTGVAMAGLVRHLGGRLDAAVVAGVLVAFMPYRLTQLAHVQILWIGCAPVVLLGLHRYRARPVWAWAGVSALAFLLLALTSGYHLVYFGAVVVMWLLWFGIPGALRAPGAWRPLAVAWALAIALIAGPLVGYWQVHARQGLERTDRETEHFSADVGDLWRAPSLARVWGRPDDTRQQESALFPGLALPLALVTGAWLARRRPDAPDHGAHRALAADAIAPSPRDGWRRLRRAAAVVGVVAVVLAVVAAIWPVDMRLAGRVVSLSSPSKSGGVAAVAGLVVLVLSPHVRAARRRGAIVPFYVLAACASAVLAMGPSIEAGDARLWTYAPYSWLATLPGGSSLRVPARFWVWTVSLLAVAAGVLLARAASVRPREARPLMAGLVVLAVVDGWPRSMPLAPLPSADPALRRTAVTDAAPVVELPMGDPARDVAAMYRGTSHGRPVVNGYSGHVPRHYRALLTAATDRDPSVLRALACDVGLLARVDLTAPDAVALEHWAREAGGHPVATDPRRVVYRLPAQPRSTAPPLPHVAIARLVETRPTAQPTAALLDADARTRWHTGGPAQPGDGLVVDLASPGHVAGIRLGLGPFLTDYPRDLLVEVQPLGDTVAGTAPAWQPVWRGATAGPTVLALLEAPLTPVVTITWAPVLAARVRLTTGGHPTAWWSMTSLAVVAPAGDSARPPRP